MSKRQSFFFLRDLRSTQFCLYIVSATIWNTNMLAISTSLSLSLSIFLYMAYALWGRKDWRKERKKDTTKYII